MLAVEGVEWKGDAAVLRLPGDGELTVQKDMVERIVLTPAIPKETDAKTEALPPQSETFQPFIRRLSEEHKVETSLITAVIKAESNFDTYAVSRAGAVGLMQVLPSTAKDYGVHDLFDPEQNLSAGTRHLSKLLSLYEGNLELALAAYNAGEKAVSRYGGIPPFRETQNYVRYVLALYRRFKEPKTAT